MLSVLFYIYYYIEISAKTLKERPNIGDIDFTIDKKKSSFGLQIGNITDKNNGIESYKYQIFKYLFDIIYTFCAIIPLGLPAVSTISFTMRYSVSKSISRTAFAWS